MGVRYGGDGGRRKNNGGGVLFCEYHYKLDNGRVTLPQRCRHRFFRGMSLYYMADENFVAGYPASCITLEDSKSAFQCSLQSRDRITLPEILRRLAGIKGAVVIVFVEDLDYVELWSEEAWLSEVEAAKKLSNGMVSFYQPHAEEIDC